jgi:hypothetical protein
VSPTESQKVAAIDLTQSYPDDERLPPRSSPSIVERLRTYGILPKGHERIPPKTLQLVEHLFIAWHELDDDQARRLALRTLIGTEAERRAVLLAIVPLYFDPFYFDEKTPTPDLVELVLIAHRKWRARLARTRS